MTKLKLKCPAIKFIHCHCNLLTNLELDFPFLNGLRCYDNPLTDLHGLEFCDRLGYLEPPSHLQEYANNLMKIIQDRTIDSD
jgi:hypothetical protein